MLEGRPEVTAVALEEVRLTMLTHPSLAPGAQKGLSANTSGNNSGQGSSASYVIAGA